MKANIVELAPRRVASVRALSETPGEKGEKV